MTEPRQMITAPAEYFAKGCGRCDRFATADCSAQRWLAGLQALRGIALAMGLTETAKWGHPCYMYAGRNICIIGAFRGDFRLSFMNASLLSDPEGVLERQGANTQHADCLRFTDPAAVLPLEPAIRALLAQAMRHAQAGSLPPKVQTDLTLPDELIEALDADPDLAEAFHALTPRRQRSWALHLTSSASPTTRRTRIEKGRAKIIAGKGATER